MSTHSEPAVSGGLGVCEKSKSLDSGESIVARQKFKGIDGGAHQEWILRLNLTQRGKAYLDMTWP